MPTQTQVFNDFRALFGSDAIPPFEDPSIKGVDNLDFVDFLIELVKQTKGQQAFKNVILRGVLGELNNNNTISNQIIKILKEKFYCNFDFVILKKYTTKSKNGIYLNVSEIDINNLFAIDPTSREGKLLYDGSDETKHLNYAIYTALSATENSPVVWEGENGVLFTLHSTGNDELLFKFGSYYENRFFSEWAEDFFKTVQFFNLPNFITTLFNIVSGVISVRVGKTTETIKSEGMMIRALQKLFGFCNEAKDENTVNNNARKFIEDNEASGFNANTDGSDNRFNDIFNLSAIEMLDLEKESNRRANNQLKFATCGDLLVPVNNDTMFNRIESLFDNVADGGFDNSVARTNLNNTIDVFDQTLKDGIKDLINNGENTLQINIPNMQVELETSLLKLIPYALMSMIMSPKLLLFVKVTMALSGESSKLTVKEVFKTIGGVISDIGKEVTSLILENIADVVKSELTKMAKIVAQKYLTKRLEDLQAVLGFLNEIIRLARGLIDAVRDRSVCQSILSKLSKIMSLGYMGPSPMIPFPLVLVGGALKSGLNEVQVVQDLKSDLQRKGIETAPFFPDGTPNYMMYALESLASTLIKHIKLNARIDVGGMAGPVPVQAFGQIT